MEPAHTIAAPSTSMRESLLIVIPTHDREGLLGRTLASLVECKMPDALTQVIIAENGAKLGAETLVERFKDRLPLSYRFTGAGNKSRALNEALENTTNEFVIFYDDDVRIDRDNPMAYWNALSGSQAPSFFCGRCEVDCEVPPPRWLLRFVPPSAKGWSLGNHRCLMSQPVGMGFNWAASVQDLRDAGWFNEHRGPGTGVRGQETEMMRRLLSRGVQGVYLPDAVAWHYVPEKRCNPSWALARAEQTAANVGMDIACGPRQKAAQATMNCRIRVLIYGLLLQIAKVVPSARFRFHQQYRLQCSRGKLRGIQSRLSISTDPASQSRTQTQ